MENNPLAFTSSLMLHSATTGSMKEDGNDGWLFSVVPVYQLHWTLQHLHWNGIQVCSFRSEGGDVHIMSSSSKKNDESSGDKTLLYVAAGAAVVAVVGYFMFASGGDSKKSRGSKKQTAKVASANKKQSKKAKRSAGSKAESSSASAGVKKSSGAVKKTSESTKSSKKEGVAKKEQSYGNLQKSGSLRDGVLTDFFNASHELLTKDETRNFLIQAHKDGKDISEELKKLQEEEWRKLGIDPEFGMEQVRSNLTLKEKIQKEPGLQNALMTAAAAEESALMCGILGSQERFVAEQQRMQKLYTVGGTTFNQRLQMIQALPDPNMQQAQMRQFGESVMAKFNQLCEPINKAKSDVERIRLRLEMNDDDIVHLIMGERFLQIQYEMQQQQGMMQ